MALEMKGGSNWWYLRYRDGKKIRQVKLTVPIKGRVPSGPGDDGDAVFRESKASAQVEHDRVLHDIRGEPGAEKAIQQLVQMKLGSKIDFPRLDALCEHWEHIPRRQQPNPRYAQQCRSALKDFAAFIKGEKADIVHFIQVTPPLAEKYMEHRAAQKVSVKTWNDTLKLLRATFKHLHPMVADGQNPFHRLVTRNLETVNRQPFSPKEMVKIVEACKDDDFIRPIIVAGMCTAMRRGDCCLLKWTAVDLKAGFITVKTSKTGQTVDIPILALFEDELRKAEDTRQEGAEYVFSEQAQMYRQNAAGITTRVQRVLCTALSVTDDGDKVVFPAMPADETRQRGLEYIASVQNPKKAARMKTVFDLYMDGKGSHVVEAETGLSRGSVSGFLNEIELNTKCRVIRWQHDGVSLRDRLKGDTTVLHVMRPNGFRRASIRDFHSFRVTWITIALAAGVPLEIVQRVTGHKTVDVVLQHYFRPGRAEFRKTLEKAMPRLFLESSMAKALTVGEVEPVADTDRKAAIAEAAVLLKKIQDGTATEDETKRYRVVSAMV